MILPSSVSMVSGANIFVFFNYNDHLYHEKYTLWNVLFQGRFLLSLVPSGLVVSGIKSALTDNDDKVMTRTTKI
jgi:hypothetical protein